MAFKKVFQCRDLAEKLSDIEFDVFTKRLRKKCGRAVLMRLLFSNFLNKQKPTDNNQQVLRDAISILSRIVRNRKMCAAEKPKKASILTISGDSLREISGFLNLSDNIAALIHRINWQA